jgi:hypothetical protein
MKDSNSGKVYAGGFTASFFNAVFPNSDTAEAYLCWKIISNRFII